MTAPGWYHADGDPAGTQRYWDGTQWVGEAQAVAPQPVAPHMGGPPPPPASRPSKRLDPKWSFAMIGGAVLTIIGVFGPWGSFLDIVSIAGSETDDGKVALACAVIAAILAGIAIPLGSQRWLRIVARVVGGLCGALIAIIFIGNYSDLNDLGGIGWGFWLSGIGGFAILALSIVGDRFFPSS